MVVNNIINNNNVNNNTDHHSNNVDPIVLGSVLHRCRDTPDCSEHLQSKWFLLLCVFICGSLSNWCIPPLTVWIVYIRKYARAQINLTNVKADLFWRSSA